MFAASVIAVCPCRKKGVQRITSTKTDAVGFTGTPVKIGTECLSLSYRPNEHWAVKAAYARTNQYVHQLSQTYAVGFTGTPVKIGTEYPVVDVVACLGDGM